MKPDGIILGFLRLIDIIADYIEKKFMLIWNYIDKKYEEVVDYFCPFKVLGTAPAHNIYIGTDEHGSEYFHDEPYGEFLHWIKKFDSATKAQKYIDQRSWLLFKRKEDGGKTFIVQDINID